MGRYALRRLIQAIPVLLGATLLIFIIVFALKGDPISARAGERPIDPTVAEALRERYHLNDPLIVQYGYFLAGLLRGDLGTTYSGIPINELLVGKIQITLNLAMVALTMEALIGIGLGLWAALRRGKAADKGVLASTLLLISLPTLVTGFLLQLLLGVQLQRSTGLDIFPISGVESWNSYLLPGFVLAGTSVAFVTRLTRTSLMETFRADYVRTAIAKGMPRRRVIGRHALRNSLIPVVTFLGADLGALMGGAVITETIFNIPGMGYELYRAAYLRERTVVVGIVTLLVFVYLLANLIVDLLYAVLDPRIRYD